MNQSPLLSIVIATKNRQKYALSAIESILSLRNKKIEIVIHDNSENDSLQKMLSKYISDKLVIYKYVKEPLSFISNFNAAIEISNGEYICIIGDDDGINSEISEVVEWCKENDVDALTGNLNANYRWEGTGVKDTFFTKMLGSTLTITHFNCKIKDVDIEYSLKEFAKNGCTNYLDFDFPKLYHGIIKKDLLEEIRSKIGHYILGLSPDIYSSLALACVVKKLLIVDYPLTISGVCAESGSVKEGQKKNHSKELENAPHFKFRGDYNWAVEVPKIYTVQTIWADSAIAALRDLGREDVLKYFDKYSLYANILCGDPSLKEMLKSRISEDVKNGDFNVISFQKKLFQFKIRDIKFKFIRRLFIIFKLKPLVTIKELDNIFEAMLALQKYMKKKKLNIIEILNNSLK